MFLKVTYTDNENFLPLWYKVYNTPPGRKFFDLVQKSIQSKSELIYSTSFYIKSIEEVLDHIQLLCDKLGLEFNGDLNSLHHILEDLTDVTKDLDRLNQLIHVIEQYEATEQSMSPRFTSFFRFDHPDTFPIENDDLLYFKIDRKFGDLCVGYNTLGKHWLEVCSTEDNDHGEEVRPQRHIGNEGYMLFRPTDDNPFEKTNMFVDWFKKYYPNNKINLEMALGYLLIGELIMPKEWIFTENQQRNNWCINVLGNHKHIHNVEIVESIDINQCIELSRMET